MDRQNNSQSQDRGRSLFGSPPGEASDSSSGGDPRQEDPKQEDPEDKNPKEKDFEDESRGGSSSEESSSEETSQRDMSQGDGPSVDTASGDTASGDTSSDSSMEIMQLNVRIPEKLHQNIKIESARRRISMKEFVTEALRQHL